MSPCDTHALVKNSMDLIRETANAAAVRTGLDPDDVFQELVLVLLELGRRYDPDRSNPTVWIRLLTCTAVRRLKNSNKPNELHADIPDRRPGHEAAVDDADEAGFVRQKLGQLSDRSAAVLRVRFGIGPQGPATISELAAHFRIPVASAQRRLDRALAEMHNLLEGHP